jgi:hypothetical protein
MADRDIQETIRRLSDEIEASRAQARNRGLAFSSPTTEELERELASSHTPVITAQAWVSRAPASSSFYYSVTVYNPDPNFYSNLFAYFFFGPADMIVDIGIALLSADQRLYRGFAQFPYIQSGSSGRVEFNYNFPAGIPLGMYVGNAFIFDRNRHGADSYKTRTSINVEII